MAVSGGRRNGVLGGDEEDAALFEEEGVEFAEEDNIDHSDIPLHLRPLVAAAESGDLNALCQALGTTYMLSNLLCLLFEIFILCDYVYYLTVITEYGFNH